MAAEERILGKRESDKRTRVSLLVHRRDFKLGSVNRHARAGVSGRAGLAPPDRAWYTRRLLQWESGADVAQRPLQWGVCRCATVSLAMGPTTRLGEERVVPWSEIHRCMDTVRDCSTLPL